MPEPASSSPAVPDAVRDVIEDPDGCETGLTCLDTALELAGDLTVAAVCKDVEGRPVLVLSGHGDVASVLGTALRVHAEVGRLRGLLERLYRGHALGFERPRLWIVAHRLSDEMWRALGPLQALGIEGREVAPARRPAPTAPIPADRAVAASDRPVAPAAAAATTAQPATPPAAPPTPGAGSLVDEAKKKILRISDEIEEEVDGDLVRFLVHDRVLAVLATAGGEFSLYVGDQPDRRRSIQSRDDLNRSLDDVFRRFFSLSRAIKGSTGPR